MRYVVTVYIGRPWPITARYTVDAGSPALARSLAIGKAQHNQSRAPWGASVKPARNQRTRKGAKK